MTFQRHWGPEFQAFKLTIWWQNAGVLILEYLSTLSHLCISTSLKMHIKKQKHYFANKGPSSQSYCFSSSHVWMWVLGCKECWVPKNWYFWTVVLENTLESPLDYKEIKPVLPKGNQSWIFTGRTGVEAETPVLMRRTDSLEKTLMLGKTEGREEKGTTEDEMAGWHHRLNGHEFE